MPPPRGTPMNICIYLTFLEIRITRLHFVELLMTLQLRATGHHLPYTVLPATRHKWTHLNPSRGRYWIYLPQRDRRLSWPRWLVTYGDGLPTHRQSSIQVLTQQCTAGSWTWSQVRCPNHYTTKPDTFPLANKQLDGRLVEAIIWLGTYVLSILLK